MTRKEKSKWKTLRPYICLESKQQSCLKAGTRAERQNW